MEEKIEYKGHTIEIWPDNDTDDPREWDNLTKIVCFHRRLKIGDKHDYDERDFEDWEELEQDLKKREKVAIIRPLYMYDHSGITISTTPFNCRWDSGQIGFVFITKAKIKEEYSCKNVGPALLKKAEKVLLSEIETYDQYLRGEVYGYNILEGEEGGEFLESVGGFYGYDECVKEAKSTIDHLSKQVA